MFVLTLGTTVCERRPSRPSRLVGAPMCCLARSRALSCSMPVGLQNGLSLVIPRLRAWQDVRTILAQLDGLLSIVQGALQKRSLASVSASRSIARERLDWCRRHVEHLIHRLAIQLVPAWAHAWIDGVKRACFPIFRAPSGRIGVGQRCCSQRPHGHGTDVAK